MPIARKRDADRRNHTTKNAEHLVIDGATAAEFPVKVPRANGNWDPRTKKWFNSIKKSAVTRFYEQSDWDTAVVAAEILDRWFGRANGSAALLTEWRALCNALLLLEGDRRRLGIEIHRGREAAQAEMAGAVTVAEYKARLGAVS